MDIALPTYVVKAIDALEAAGFEAWCVGGCVRDALLGRPMHDYDLATDALWTQTKAVFEAEGCATYETGTAHGTLSVSVDGHVIEITTYRTDGAYSDARHPDSVEFVRSIEEDLARRDFTMNALAYHPKRGMLDLYGGTQDLNDRLIRVVGDPKKRFREDALRILRGCRFRSQLGFSLEPQTLKAMKAGKRGLARVSAERIAHELDELLLGDHVHDALLECIDVLGFVLPELVACKDFDQHTPYHIYDVLEHTAWVVQQSPATRLGRWAALLHDIGKPAAFFMDGDRGHFYGHAEISVVLGRDIMKRMLMSPAFIDRVLTLVRLHDDVIPANNRAVRRALANMGGDVELFEALCDLKRADALSQSDLGFPRAELALDLRSCLSAVLEADDAFTLKQLAINGGDVIALGADEGPQVGQLLHEALDAVIDERVPNEREALYAFVRDRIA